MNLNLTMDDADDLKPRITVFGVGGAGGNAVNNMIEKQLDGCVFVVANTDAQALNQSHSEARVQLGPKVTEGLGAGAKPEIGARAAEETIEDIVDHLQGAHMCFITAGMGGGTGTGAAPIIAQAARQMGILTVGVVTKPFQFEGTKRMRQANAGVEELQKHVDTLIIIPNQNLFRLANEKTTFTDAFAMADDVLYQGVKGVTDLMVRPGLINLDFADVRAVMDEMGKAMMGTGEGTGENRAVEAAEKAIANPLLDEISLNGAKGVLINITGGTDLTLFELDEAANIIRDKVDEDANIIVGSTLDPEMEGAIRVSVVATGIDAEVEQAAPPAPQRRVEAEARPAQPTARPVPQTGTRPAAQAATATQSAMPSQGASSSRGASPRVQQAAPDEAELDMPGPAYQPREDRDDFHARPLDEDAGGFVAPRPGSSRGKPSSSYIEQMRNNSRAQAGSASSRPGPVAEPRRRADAPQEGENRMAGLGRMLERMGGRQSDKPSAASISERVSERMSSARRKPASESDFDDLADDSGDSTAEIPAFLRRQAN